MANLRVRNYKLQMLDETRTPEGRKRVAEWLLRHGPKPRLTKTQIVEIVNNQLPAKQKPFSF